jgi:hypothetical protein
MDDENIDLEWEQFLSDGINHNIPDTTCMSRTCDENSIPVSSDLYISTKSKIAYLNSEIDLKDLFWKLNVIPYNTRENGVVKKQMKYIFDNPEEVEMVEELLSKELYSEQQIITKINNEMGRIKFKDIRKISVGISKKDVLSYRSKKKSAFYNCFVLIVRLKIDDIFREFHVKIFNTGKMKLPGVRNDAIFYELLDFVKGLFQPFMSSTLEYDKHSDTVLINSNFNCGFYINQEELYKILLCKYNIQCIYDPCSYPGIQCKFYYDYTNTSILYSHNTDKPIYSCKSHLRAAEPTKKVKRKKTVITKDEEELLRQHENRNNNIVVMSFMIFRTGTILIVGMCEEDVIQNIYKRIKQILHDEYHAISLSNIDDTIIKPLKVKKSRKRVILVDNMQ